MHQRLRARVRERKTHKGTLGHFVVDHNQRLAWTVFGHWSLQHHAGPAVLLSKHCAWRELCTITRDWEMCMSWKMCYIWHLGVTHRLGFSEDILVMCVRKTAILMFQESPSAHMWGLMCGWWTPPTVSRVCHISVTTAQDEHILQQKNSSANAFMYNLQSKS